MRRRGGDRPHRCEWRRVQIPDPIFNPLDVSLRFAEMATHGEWWEVGGPRLALKGRLTTIKYQLSYRRKPASRFRRYRPPARINLRGHSPTYVFAYCSG